MNKLSWVHRWVTVLSVFVILTPALFNQTIPKPVATKQYTAVLPLEAHGELRTEAPYRTRGFLGSRICDSSGSVYLRYAPEKGWIWAAPITKIDAVGKTKTIPIGEIPNLKNQELLAFAVAGGDKLVEVVRGHPGDAHELVAYYAEFEEDGSLISKSAFEKDFVPYIVVPLPAGDFFAMGAIANADVENRKTKTTSIAAIFGSDAKIDRVVKKIDSPESDGIAADSSIVNGKAVLADDGTIYVFLAGDPVEVLVISQSGTIQRQMTLPAPIPKAEAAQMFVSGGRMVVTWTPTSDGHEQQPRVALYEAQSGVLLRLFEPKYGGSPVCFDGKTLTIMSVMKAGYWAFATADVE